MAFSGFIGRQLSRLKAGQTYYLIVINTISALGIVNLAFPQIDTIWLIALFPILLFGSYLIGLFMDRGNVVTMDQLKSLEMTHRYMNTADYKLYDFHLMKMRIMFKWMESVQFGKDIDVDKLMQEEYKEFLKQWQEPGKEK